MRNEKTQSGERNMLHTLFTIFIFFFLFLYCTVFLHPCFLYCTIFSKNKKKEKKKKS